MSIPNEEYYRWKSAIEEANRTEDREALKAIQKQIIAKYGMDDRDAEYLLKMFRYSV